MTKKKTQEEKEINEADINTLAEKLMNETTEEEKVDKSEDKSDPKDSNVEKLLQEKNDLNEKYLRLAADFQNYKRRVENEKNEIYNYANEKIVSDLLNVLDNFERAISSMEKSTDKTLLDGIVMINKQLIEILSKYGLKEIETEKTEFDPNYHHAVLKETVDGVESNMIIEVFQKGYTLSDRVIRPSMVKVAE